METKGIIKVRKDSKLGMYRYLMEKAMVCENWESYEFWSDKYNIEWIKIYGNKKRKGI